MNKHLFILCLFMAISFFAKSQDQQINGTYFKTNGSVGVNTSSPLNTLHVEGSARIGNTAGGGRNIDINTNCEIRSNNGWLHLNRFGGMKVAIGYSEPADLTVNGKILTEEVKVQTITGADFVFAPNYHLMPLEEVKSYIESNQHLPEIPSAQEMQNNGLDLGEMNIKLLQKIEELTLYQIQLLEALEAQEKRIVELENLIKN